MYSISPISEQPVKMKVAEKHQMYDTAKGMGWEFDNTWQWWTDEKSTILKNVGDRSQLDFGFQSGFVPQFIFLWEQWLFRTLFLKTM